MTTVRVFFSRLVDLVFRSRRERRLAEEIEDHLNELTNHHVERGMALHDARLAARRSFGNVERIRMLHREERSMSILETLIVDVRSAGRLLANDVRFTTGVVLVLALGLAVNTTIFTIVNGMTWRHLPVLDGDRIVQISSQRVGRQREGTYTSYADYRDWRASARSLQDLAAYATGTMNLGDDSQPAERLSGVYVSEHTFRLLGIQPVLGRDFPSAQEPSAEPPLVMLGHHVWTARYNADRTIVGRRIRVNGTAMTVIGVMPAGFQFPLRADLWQPAGQLPGLDTANRLQRRFDIVARLADGATVPEAQAEMDAITKALAAQFPASNGDIGARARRFTHAFVAPPPEAQEPLVMMIAAAIVLLIACGNGATLLLARAAHRTREMAMRATLGASQYRIARQLLVEALLIAAIAAAVGLIFSRFAVSGFARETVDLNLPFWIAFEFDARVFAYVATICLGTAVACGLVPAWQLSKTDAHEVLKEGGRGTIGSARSRRWAGALLVGEIALTLVLSGAAATLVRSNAALARQDRVLDLDALVTAQIGLPAGRYDTPEKRRALHQRIRDQLARPTGPVVGQGNARHATLSSARPFVDATSRELWISGEQRDGSARLVQAVGVDDDYFEILGLALRSGRALQPGDAVPGRQAVVINDRFAALYFPDGHAVGQRIRLVERGRAAPESDAWFTIVGVSPSVRQRPMSEAAPIAYLPLDVQLGSTLALTAHDAGDRARTAAVLRERLRAIDPDVALYNIQPLRRLSELSRWPATMVTLVLALFATIASVLSAAGLYGLTAYGVAQRTSEIGVRMALGAERSQIAWFLLRTTLLQVALGLAIGLAGVIAATALLRGLLVRSTSTDPIVLLSSVAVLALVVAAACFVPARRAVRLDPLTALRHD